MYRELPVECDRCGFLVADAFDVWDGLLCGLCYEETCCRCSVCRQALFGFVAAPSNSPGVRLCFSCFRLWNWYPPSPWDAFKSWLASGLSLS